ncbi:MAG: diguanylate cyclase domain-containing protein [Xenococcaceae cyanobacterium]
MDSHQANNREKVILVVEELLNELCLLIVHLQESGYRVLSANSGKKAIDVAVTQLPELILLNVNISDLDSYWVCQTLKARQQTANIPVIFFGELKSSLSKVRTFQVGGADYLARPFQIEELLLRIDRQMKFKKQKAILEKQIQQQKKQTEVLSQSHAYLNSILNISRDGIAAFAAIRDESSKVVDFRSLFINPVAAKIFKRDLKDLTSKSLWKKHFDRLEPTLFDLCVRVVEMGMVVEKDCTLKQALSTWYQLAIVKLGDGIVITLRDITERKQTELFWQAANLELYRQANLDSLTQISNRRRFDEYFQQEWQRCARDRQPLALILCDVDFFKSYNDRYGHQAGDRCLQQIASAIARAIKRPGDLVARYGGEEFVVVLSNTDCQGAEYIAKLISRHIKRLKIVRDESEVSSASDSSVARSSKYVTVSLGVSSHVPNSETTPESFLQLVDRALYEAKNLGRDRIVIKNWQLQQADENNLNFNT